MERPNDVQEKLLLSPQLVTMMTTEQYVLQTGRSKTTSEIAARASLFVGAVSSALIALAFIGQTSRLGTTFYVFSLVLFPALVFLGLTSFIRILQTGSEDMIYALGVNRIRHFYLDQAPQLQPYLMLSAHDDLTGYWSHRGEEFSWRQPFFTPGGMVAFINSILVGAFVSLLLYALWTLPLLPCVGAGVAAFLVSVGLHLRYQWKHWQRVSKRLTVLFPSEPAIRRV